MKKAQCGECGRAGGYPLYCMRCAEEMLKQSEQEKYKLAETDIYDFAGWLTTRAGVMKVGASSDASLMSEAVGEYIKTFPERFSVLQRRDGLTEQQIKYLLSEYIKTFPNRFSALQQRPWVGLTDEEVSQVIEMGLGVRDSIETALEKLQDKNSC